ncbi:MAG: hypothetical protein Q8O06_00075 [Acetobacterium sp.]|nr:hypothetical protein [Acetobacterium sp.]
MPVLAVHSTIDKDVGYDHFERFISGCGPETIETGKPGYIVSYQNHRNPKAVGERGKNMKQNDRNFLWKRIAKNKNTAAGSQFDPRLGGALH